ncbi:MAG: hypothetical protein Q7S27_00335 [Nanoarchaeota archaeon]|nr:hypothetical protein [Nanoarchaeota archaeon]
MELLSPNIKDGIKALDSNFNEVFLNKTEEFLDKGFYMQEKDFPKVELLINNLRNYVKARVEEISVELNNKEWYFLKKVEISKFNSKFSIIRNNTPIIPPSFREKVIMLEKRGKDLFYMTDRSGEDIAGFVDYDQYHRGINQIYSQGGKKEIEGLGKVVLEGTSNKNKINLSLIDSENPNLFYSGVFNYKSLASPLFFKI